MDVYADNTGLNGEETISAEWKILAPSEITFTRAELPSSDDFFEGFEMDGTFNYATSLTSNSRLTGNFGATGPSNRDGVLGSYYFTVDADALPGTRAFDIDPVWIWLYPIGFGYEQPYVIQNTPITIVLPVVGRHVLYNDSAFDGNDPAASSADDGAIATDKAALLPGEIASFANYTSYSKGINGVMVDIGTLTAAPVAADFQFKVGNSNDPSTWATAPDPTGITVRPDEGVSGTDRVTILWTDNAIEKQWLQITVKATANTGLATDDVFYFGNAIGETGNSAADAEVTPADEIGVRNNPHDIKTNPAAIDDAYDFNRDKKVGPTDQVISRNNGTNSSTALQLITVP